MSNHQPTPQPSRVSARIALLAALSVACMLAFAAGAVTAIERAWGQPLATVRIENRSGQPLKHLELRFSGSAAKGSLQLPALHDGANVEARFYAPGETGYVVHAVLSDGTLLKAAEGYVESGYRVTEIIRKTEIQSAVGYISPSR